MTRAALLHLLAAPESLPATAVQDLEQLAQAFPYCQTAHVLLAKAAHDQGSMLAGQRLRRAATYATDRQLLRQLLERPAQFPTPPAPANPSSASEAVAPEMAHDAITVTATAPEPLLMPALTASALAVEAPMAINEPPASTTEAASLVEVEGIALEAAVTALAEPLSGDVAEPVAPTSLPEEAVVALPTRSVTTENELPPISPEEPVRSVQLVEKPLSGMPTTQGVELQEAAVEDVTAKNSAVAAVAAAVDYLITDATTEPDPAPLLIRPPAEAGAARFEFGLTPSPALESGFSAYQLPEAGPEEPLAGAPASQAAAQSGVAAFAGDANLAYALSGGSRLGYAMQLVFALPENSLPPPALPTVETPGSPLPPAGEFFAPDALLLEHLARQPPPAPAVPSSLELIDSFLRRAPQRRRGIVTLLTVPEQADLSLRSTRAEPDLASESLARILAGQGKTERAIAVYERLMVRQPEKSAYFAVQIDLLRNPRIPSS